MDVLMHSQCICNDRAGVWISDEGTQVFKTAESSGSVSNASCRAGFNTMR
jgi:hypothetical protein